MTAVLVWVLRVLVALALLGAALWGAGVLWYAVPLAAWGLPGWLAPLLLGLLGLFALLAVFAVLFRRGIGPALPLAAALAALFVWWASLDPSNDRVWQRDVAALPYAEIAGDRVTLHNLRNFTYRTEQDYTPHWETRSYDLAKLDSLDLIAVYWMGDDIAHIMLSFGFGEDKGEGDYLTVSIETRKEEGEAYSTLAGFFRQYELYYVVADERDLIDLRTTYRAPPEDVYLYRVQARDEAAGKAKIRALFLDYLAEINALKDEAQWYNTLTTNCTTNVVTHVHAIGGSLPLNWEVLLSGHFPKLVYDHGGLDRSLPYDALRADSLVNDRARAASGSPDFSARIREGLPGME